MKARTVLRMMLTNARTAGLHLCSEREWITSPSSFFEMSPVHIVVELRCWLMSDVQLQRDNVCFREQQRRTAQHASQGTIPEADPLRTLWRIGSNRVGLRKLRNPSNQCCVWSECAAKKWSNSYGVEVRLVCLANTSTDGEWEAAGEVFTFTSTPLSSPPSSSDKKTHRQDQSGF